MMKIVITSCAIAASCAILTPALAQNAVDTGQFPPMPAGADEYQVSEIVVTANRRAQALSDVAASVTALTGDQLEQRGIDSFEGLVGNVPGLTLNQAVKNRAVFNIRGIATSTGGDNSQDPVAVYINDTPVTDTFGAAVQPDLRLFDIERVEFLRGPQGTLFGSGSLGGTVRIITRQPNATAAELEGQIDLGVTRGGAFRQRYDAMINLPLVNDVLAVRAVGYFRDEEGWVRNVALGTRNDTEDWGGRLALRWTPGPETSGKLEIIHQNSDPRDGDSWNPQLGKFRRASAIAEGRPARLTNISGTIQHEIPDFAALVSITTYQKSRTALFADSGDQFGLGLPLVQRSSPWDSRFVTQEFRAVSLGESAFQWVAGLFFIDRRTDVNFELALPGLGGLFGVPVDRDAFFISPITSKAREYAAFADANFRFADQWVLTGGFRVFRTEVSYDEPARQTLDFSTFELVESSFSNSGKSTNTTWRAILAYEPTDASLLYASVSKGFRIGQANPNVGPSPVDPDDVIIPTTYRPDTTVNYETGAKWSSDDRRFSANLAAFYIDWKDIQIDANRLSDDRAFIANAGRAVSKGVELELAAQPARGLSLGFSMTVQNSKIKRIDLVDSQRSGVVAGDRLPGAVRLKLGGNAEYRWDMSDTVSAFVRADGEYTGSSRNGFSAVAGSGDPNPFLARNQAYENISIVAGVETGRYSVSAYIENLTDNDAFILNDGGSSPNPVNTLRPRTIGIRAGAKF